MSEPWLERLLALAQAERAVRVVVAAVRGSGPREAGACMLVEEHTQAGSIGGGQLEHVALHRARRMIAAGNRSPAWDRVDYPLGPSVGQCCGGVVTLVYQSLDGTPQWASALAQCLQDAGSASLHTRLGAGVAQTQLHEAGADRDGAQLLSAAVPVRLVENLRAYDFALWLFGAGHVACALAQALEPLRCRLTWVDQRAEAFPPRTAPGVRVRVTGEPVSEARKVPRDAFALVMTHSHALDLELCAALLGPAGPGFVGLIGSLAKRRSFHRRLRERGLADALPRLVCPIGIPGLAGKRPAEIAASAAAQLLLERGRVRDKRASSAQNDPRGEAPARAAGRA